MDWGHVLSILIPVATGLILLYGQVKSISVSVANHIKGADGKFAQLSDTLKENKKSLSRDVRELDSKITGVKEDMEKEFGEMKIVCAASRTAFESKLTEHSKRLNALNSFGKSKD